MKMQRRLALAVSLLAVGLGAGHLVQSRSAKPAPLPAADQTAALPDEALPAPQNVQQVAAGAEDMAPAMASSLMPLAPKMPLPQEAKADPTLPMAAPDPAPMAAQPAAPATAATASAEACPMTLDLLADANAMIGITLSAPCRPDQRVVVKHAGLAVTARTSASGSLFLNLPALETAARLELTFPDGEKIASSVDMPEAAALRRFAVQWLERDAFQLQAFEGGADYGQPGHVSALTPHTPAPGIPAAGGFVTLLGTADVDLPMLAEVYTFPARGDAEVLVEAAVTAETCGRELLGETLTAEGGKVAVSELTLAMPECDALGDILVLKNLMPEMKLAAR